MNETQRISDKKSAVSTLTKRVLTLAIYDARWTMSRTSARFRDRMRLFRGKATKVSGTSFDKNRLR